MSPHAFALRFSGIRRRRPRPANQPPDDELGVGSPAGELHAVSEDREDEHAATRPGTLPSPPMKLTPPRMAAVRAVNSVPGPKEEWVVLALEIITIVPTATRNPQIGVRGRS